MPGFLLDATGRRLLDSTGKIQIQAAGQTCSPCCPGTGTGGMYYPLHRCDGVVDGMCWYSSVPPTAPPFTIIWHGNGKCYYTLPDEALVSGTPIDNNFNIVSGCNDCACGCATCQDCGCPTPDGNCTGCTAVRWLITLSGVSLCGSGGCFRCPGGLGFQNVHMDGTACYGFTTNCFGGVLTDFNPATNVMDQISGLALGGTDCSTAEPGQTVVTGGTYLSVVGLTRNYNSLTGMIDWQLEINGYGIVGPSGPTGSNFPVFLGWASSADCTHSVTFANTIACDDGTTGSCQPISGGTAVISPCGC